MKLFFIVKYFQGKSAEVLNFQKMKNCWF